jgi:hypothetical protein
VVTALAGFFFGSKELADEAEQVWVALDQPPSPPASLPRPSASAATGGPATESDNTAEAPAATGTQPTVKTVEAAEQRPAPPNAELTQVRLLLEELVAHLEAGDPDASASFIGEIERSPTAVVDGRLRPAQGSRRRFRLCRGRRARAPDSAETGWWLTMGKRPSRLCAFEYRAFPEHSP